MHQPITFQVQNIQKSECAPKKHKMVRLGLRHQVMVAQVSEVRWASDVAFCMSSIQHLKLAALRHVKRGEIRMSHCLKHLSIFIYIYISYIYTFIYILYTDNYNFDIVLAIVETPTCDKILQDQWGCALAYLASAWAPYGTGAVRLAQVGLEGHLKFWKWSQMSAWLPRRSSRST